MAGRDLLPCCSSKIGRLAVTALLAVGGAAIAAAPADSALRMEGARANALLFETLIALYDKVGSTDIRYFGGDAYQNGDLVCTACNLGAATAAAVARWQDPTLPAWLDDSAVRAVNNAIAAYQQPDGSFTDSSVGSASIATMFFANEVGNSLVAMRNRLTDADRLRWIASTRSAADFLLERGELTWYANGNIALGNAEVMELAWLATSDPKYKTLYDTALSSALNPNQILFPGRGLIITKAGTRSDGSDGAGYLTEEGPGGVGFDPGYGVLQLGVATRMWLATGDPRTLRVLNLLTNQMLKIVDSTWMLAAGGTRTSPGTWAFTSGALAALVARGGRSDLSTMFTSQWTRIQQEDRAALTYGTHGFYRSLAIELAPSVAAFAR
jgi:type IV secretory pathway TrbD component